jgi:hypothetical protein
MKSRSSHLKKHLDPAAWVFPGELNATKNSVRCNGSLAEVSGEVNVEFIGFLSPLTARNATFVEEKSVKSS